MALLFAASICLHAPTVEAAPDEHEPAAGSNAALSWPFPKFRPAEYVATGVLGAAWFAVFFAGHGSATPHWSGGILFDDATRDAVRLRSPQARDTARLTSDIGAISASLIAVSIDALAVPLLRGSPAVAWQLVLIDAQSFALSGLLTTAAFDLTGRARPSYDDCQRDPGFDPLCRSGPTSSFWSGHTSGAFTAAGLSCAHHAYLHLYGNATADALGCAGIVTLATATGVFRLLGDRHFATDVITGAAVGFGIGYGLPTLLHYTAARNQGVTIAPSAAGVGLTIAGAF